MLQEQETDSMAKIPLNIRIDPELRARLKKQAGRENRTLSNLVDTIMREYLDQASRRSRKRSEATPPR